MGRGKLKAELIANERSRMITYQKRKRGLIKKVEEFNILCNVDTCVIIYRPQLNHRPADLEAWPADTNKIRRIVHRYKNNGPDVRARKTQDLSDYFVAWKKKVEDDIAKLHKASLEASFLRWPGNNDLNLLTLQQLLGLERALEAKTEAVERRILELRSGSNINIQGNYYSETCSSSTNRGSSLLSYNFGHAFHQMNNNPELELLLDTDRQQQPISSATKFQTFDLLGRPQSYPFEQTTVLHQMLPFDANANASGNSTLRPFMTNNIGEEFSQFGGVTGSRIPYYDHPFATTSVVENNAKLMNNIPVAFPAASCHSYSVQPAMPYMLQGPMLLNSSPTQTRGAEITQLYDGNQFEVDKKGSI